MLGDAHGLLRRLRTMSVTCTTTTSGRKAPASISLKTTRVAGPCWWRSADSAFTAKSAKNCALIPNAESSMAGQRNMTSPSQFSRLVFNRTWRASIRQSLMTMTLIRTWMTWSLLSLAMIAFIVCHASTNAFPADLFTWWTSLETLEASDISWIHWPRRSVMTSWHWLLWATWLRWFQCLPSFGTGTG